MMSSLVPGTIFITSGLNRKSTPTPPDITPAQLDQKYRRVDFNGHDWPADSPVSRSYDVSNTSTKLIILNNKYGKKSTRLRGYYTGPKRPERNIDPDRHRAPSPRNPRFHEACYDSSSPKFEPAIKTDLEWINTSHRPPNALIGVLLNLSNEYRVPEPKDYRVPEPLDNSSEKDAISLNADKISRQTDSVSINLSSIFDERSDDKMGNQYFIPTRPPLHKARTSVNPKRHASCRASPDLQVLHESRPHSRFSLPPNKYFTSSEFADMSMGEKIYLWSIEKIYNMDRMKKLKQEQYRKLLDMEAKKGYHGYQEYVKYMRYIDSAKDRNYGTGSPSDRHSRSSHSPRSLRSRSASSRIISNKSDTKSHDDKPSDEPQPERPKTSIGQVRTEPLNDSKPPADDTKPPTEDSKPKPAETRPHTTSGSSEERKSQGSQKSLQKSPYASRASSAKSVKSATRSQRSLRSQKSKSSAVSPKSGEQKKADNSDNSLTNGEEDVHPLHKEGKDRPLSRLGHPGADDRDKDSLHSSTLSIKSDTNSISSDSGVGNGRTPAATKHTAYPSTSGESNSSTKRTADEKSNNNTSKASTKKMGSRASISSKSSIKSGNGDKEGIVNQRKDEKKEGIENQRKDEKLQESVIEKPEPKMKSKPLETEDKVHRVPSGSLTKDETTNEEKTDEEKEPESKSVNKNVNASSEPVSKGSEDLPEEEQNKTALDNEKKLSAEESKNVENKPELHVHYADEEPIRDNNVENMHQENEHDGVDVIVEEHVKEDASNKRQDEGNKPDRLIPKRKDSFFDDDDEDRRVNKDLDKIEY